MDIFIARQPILDVHRRTTAYELLYRDGPENVFPRVDGTRASSRVMHDSLHVFGVEQLAAGKRAFVNVTRELLLHGAILALPPRLAAIEILESVEPDDEVVAACRMLKSAGYLLALDDFVLRPGYDRLVAIADVVKIDFRATRGDERRTVAERCRPMGVRLLAEKVETAEEFEEAVRFGYDLFQGYFFARPQMIAAKDIPASKRSYLRLLAAVNEPEFHFDKVEALVKEDVALAVKLLRYLNSAAIACSHDVRSIRHALVMLGVLPFRRWVSLLAMIGLADGVPPEAVTSSLVRSRLCELLADQARPALSSADAFLVGLLSQLDVLLGRSLAEALESVWVGPDVQRAVLRGEGGLGALLRLAVAFERGAWPSVTREATHLGIDAEGAISDAYRAAVAWADHVHAEATRPEPAAEAI